MKLRVTTMIDAPVEKVWQEVCSTRLLAYVASPLMAFDPVDPPRLPARWEAGDYRVMMKALGFLPLGKQIIGIRYPRGELAGREANAGPLQLRDAGSGALTKVWDHLITISARDDGRTCYIDDVEIKAGLLTPFIWLFALVFYRHRQARWRRLAAMGFDYAAAFGGKT